MEKKNNLSRFHLFFLFVLLVPCWVIGAKYFVDLKTIVKVAQLVHQDPLLVYKDFSGEAGRFFYGPIFIWLVGPMAWIPSHLVTYAWLIPQTLSYVVFWLGLLKLMPNIFGKENKWWWFLLFSFAINPIHNNFQSNNIQLILCAMLVLSEVLLAKGSPVSDWFGALLVSLASVIKIFPLFVWAFYFLIKGKRVKVALLVTLLGFVGFPALWVGWGGAATMYQGLIANVTTYQADNSLVDVVDILCLPSLVARLGHQGGISESVYAFVTKLIIVITSVVFFGFAYRKRNEGREYLINVWEMGLALMAFLNPSTRVHYFIFYVPAFCSVIGSIIKDGKRSVSLIVTAVLSFVAIALTTEGVVGKGLNNNLEALSIPTWGFVLLLCGMVLVLKEPRGTVRTS